MPIESEVSCATGGCDPRSVRSPVRMRTVASPAVLRELAATVLRAAASVEQCGAALVRAADGLSRCPAVVRQAGTELFRCARLALTAETDELRRTAQAIADGAVAYRATDAEVATAMARP